MCCVFLVHVSSGDLTWVVVVPFERESILLLCLLVSKVALLDMTMFHLFLLGPVYDLFTSSVGLLVPSFTPSIPVSTHDRFPATMSVYHEETFFCF